MTIGYDANVLAADLNFSLLRGDALGIIGGNGTGKTTLIKTLMGNLPELGGKVHWGTKTNVGYYSQNLEGLEPRNEVVQELRRVAPGADNVTLRGFLAKFLFYGEDVFKPVSALSGGEKGRLALAKLIYSQKNVLILDEPTNHLDIPSRESLENALDEYDGTIIAVSHDRFFLDKIASKMLSFENDGSVLIHNGNYTDFHDWKAEREVVAIPSLRGSKELPKGEKESSGNGRGNLSKNQRLSLERRIREIESEIPKLENEAALLSEEMTDPKTAADFPKLSKLSDKIKTVESRTKTLYEEWEDASAALD